MFDMTICHAGLARSDAVYEIHNQFDESAVIARVFFNCSIRGITECKPGIC